MPNEHAFIGPSSAKRWLACPLAPWLEAQCPQTAGAAAQEGTDAHQLAEHCLIQIKKTGREVAAREFFGKVFNRAGRPTESFGVTEDMADAVQVFLDWTRPYRGQDWIWQAEGRVTWREVEWPAGGPRPEGYDSDLFPLWGTADFRAVSLDGKRRVGADYKHGKGIFVEAEDNPQLISYNMAGLTPEKDDCQEFLLAIVQPRCPMGDPVREWVVGRGERQDWRRRIIEGANLVLETGPDGEGRPGEHCDLCHGKRLCPQWASRAMELAAIDFDTAPEPTAEEIAGLLAPKAVKAAKKAELPLADMTTERLAWIWAQRAMVDRFLECVEAELWARARAGAELPGLKVVRGRGGDRQWEDPETAGPWLEEMGADPYVRVLMSPAKAEKALGKDLWETLGVDDLVTRNEGKPKLVAKTAKGVELDPSEYGGAGEFDEAPDAWEED